LSWPCCALPHCRRACAAAILIPSRRTYADASPTAHQHFFGPPPVTHVMGLIRVLRHPFTLAGSLPVFALQHATFAPARGSGAQATVEFDPKEVSAATLLWLVALVSFVPLRRYAVWVPGTSGERVYSVFLSFAPLFFRLQRHICPSTTHPTHSPRPSTHSQPFTTLPANFYQQLGPLTQLSPRPRPASPTPLAPGNCSLRAGPPHPPQTCLPVF
jgi:hypothetical protein